MSTGKWNSLQDAVINNSKWIDRVLWGLLLTQGTIILIKLAGKSTFVWGGVEFNTNKAWAILSLVTIAHLYVTVLFHTAAVKFAERSSDYERHEVFERITTSGGLFVRGLIARTKRRGRVYVMKRNDPTTIVSHVAAVLFSSQLSRLTFQTSDGLCIPAVQLC
jgi:hypothetical protein